MKLFIQRHWFKPIDDDKGCSKGVVRGAHDPGANIKKLLIIEEKPLNTNKIFRYFLLGHFSSNLINHAFFFKLFLERCIAHSILCPNDDNTFFFFFFSI